MGKVFDRCGFCTIAGLICGGDSIVSITWNEGYRLPYESQWGLDKKHEFLDALPTEQKVRDDFLKARDVEAESIITQKQLRYCPKCLKYGYHSPLHQLNYMDTCFLHTDQMLLPTRQRIVPWHEESPFSTLRVRGVDVMSNALFAAQIQDRVRPAFDSITLFDLLNAKNIYRPYIGNKLYKSTSTLLNALLFHECQPSVNCRLVTSFDVADSEGLYQDVSIELIDRYICTDTIKRYYKGDMVPVVLWKSNAWKQNGSMIFLRIHRWYISLISELGGYAAFERLLHDLNVCAGQSWAFTYEQYAKAAFLMLLTGFTTSKEFENMLWDPPVKKGHSDKLNICRNEGVSVMRVGNGMTQCFPNSQNTINLIKDKILLDLWRFSVPGLEWLLSDGTMDEVRHRLLPVVSQYVVVEKGTKRAVYACQPDAYALLSNINRRLYAPVCDLKAV